MSFENFILRFKKFKGAKSSFNNLKKFTNKFKELVSKEIDSAFVFGRERRFSSASSKEVKGKIIKDIKGGKVSINQNL